jgi:hypothetical protein
VKALKNPIKAQKRILSPNLRVGQIVLNRKRETKRVSTQCKNPHYSLKAPMVKAQRLKSPKRKPRKSRRRRLSRK